MSTLFDLPEEQEGTALSDMNEVEATPLPVTNNGMHSDTISPTVPIRHEARSRLTDRMGHESSGSDQELLSRGANLREQVTMSAANLAN